MDSEISSRIQKASQALGRLKKKVLLQKSIRLSTKLKVYRAVVVSTLLYGCETTCTYHRCIQQQEQFHARALRVIMGIHWKNRPTNQEALEKAGSTSIESMLQKTQLCWTGHVIRMTGSHIPRQLLSSELMQDERKQGRPKPKFKLTLKSKLKWSGISPHELEASDADRSVWRPPSSRAAVAFEEDWRQCLAAARDIHHRAASASVQTTDCRNICGCLCASSFGLAFVKKFVQLGKESDILCAHIVDVIVFQLSIRH